MGIAFVARVESPPPEIYPSGLCVARKRPMNKATEHFARVEESAHQFPPSPWIPIYTPGLIAREEDPEIGWKHQL